MTSLKNLLFYLSTFCVPPPPSLTRPQTPCTSPVLRKEWGSATTTEKQSYTNAVLCLATKPSRIGNNGTSLYDDFAFVYNALHLHFHGVPHFYPWHRYYLHVYEKALKDCGYTGAIMYWNWAADSEAPANASVWSPVDGFGGNGNITLSDPWTHCIMDGPFVNLRPHYYENEVHSHCIMRNFAPGHPEKAVPEMLGSKYSSQVVAEILALPNFLDFHAQLQIGPHPYVHAGIAGTHGYMAPTTGPNDPIFFLHHAMLDRVWYLWQANPSKRAMEFAGSGFDDVPATLQDMLPMMGLAPERKVEEFMTMMNTDLCYTY